MIKLDNRQARRFILLKQGLLGEYQFIGKQGALDYIRQTGCVQFDPVDSCGKNAELVLQSRVKGFTKQILDELLYKDRLLFDYTDKNLSIIPTEDWPCFRRYREAARIGGKRFEGLAELSAQALAYIAQHGPVSSNELPLSGKLHWYSHIHWSGNWGGDSNAARSVLEQLYSTGELVIHHKKGTRKFYDLTQNHIPAHILNASDPFPDEFEHQKWRVLRRIGAVGLLWNRSSDAWLNIWGLKTPQRNLIFNSLLQEKKVFPIQVEGFNDMLYGRSEDLPLIEAAMQGLKQKPRCELLAPLDCFLWDRKLVKALFDFDYTWEIYTPAHKRKYGFYVLPILYDHSFAGRVEAVNDRKSNTLVVKKIWYEDSVSQTKKWKNAFDKCLRKFADFNDCDEIHFLQSADP